MGSWASNLIGALWAVALPAFGTLVFWSKWPEPTGGVIVFGLGTWCLGLASFYALIRAARDYTPVHLQVGDSGFRVGGHQFFAFDRITHVMLFYQVTRKSVNFTATGEDHNVLVEVTVAGERRPLRFRAGPTLGISTGSFGRDDSDELILKCQRICERSFEVRSAHYIAELRHNGYFTYDNKRVFLDGDVTFGYTRVNLKTTAMTRDPFVLKLQRMRFAIFGHDRIRTEIDADVFFWLLEMLFGIAMGTDGRMRVMRVPVGLPGVPNATHLKWLRERYDDDTAHAAFDSRFGPGAAKRFMKGKTGRHEE